MFRNAIQQKNAKALFLEFKEQIKEGWSTWMMLLRAWGDNRRELRVVEERKKYEEFIREILPKYAKTIAVNIDKEKAERF